MDCPGDEFSQGAASRFVGAPIFHFSDDGVKFGIDGVGRAYGDYGSVSGFLPQ
jgi:hypothetical protein